MADDPRLPDPAGLPRAVPREPGPRLLQPIWIIPVVAILIAGWIALKHFLEQGPTIVVQFQSAEGIEAGKTRIKHKAVDIGIVRRIELADDHKSVIVTAEVDRKARDFLVEDTRFWVVRPRIAGGEVSGLSTLLAGSYIGGDPGTSGNERRHFEHAFRRLEVAWLDTSAGDDQVLLVTRDSLRKYGLSHARSQ